MQITVRLRRKFGFYIPPINSPNHLKKSNVYTDELTKFFPRINSPQNIQHSHGQTPAQLVTTNNHINSDRSIDQSLVDRINLLMYPCIRILRNGWIACNAMQFSSTGLSQSPFTSHEKVSGDLEPCVLSSVGYSLARLSWLAQIRAIRPQLTIRTSSAKVIFTVRSIINNQFACKFQFHRIFRSLGPNH